MRPILIAIAACLFASAALTAQTKQAPLQTAERMGDRIIAATPYTFTNKQTGEVYTNVTKLPLDLNVRVTDKRNDWHYTNGVLALAMMELADASGDAKYEAYVLKNMNFVFNEGNLDFFRRQYDKVKADEGWKGVRNLSWHMIFRGKRLDDNGPMAASLIELQPTSTRPPTTSTMPSRALPTAPSPASGPTRIPSGPTIRLWRSPSLPAWGA
jgi:unsaturated rhamnogalacturonyl hydrolase